MAALKTAPREEIIEVAGLRTQVRRGGQGAPLLVIHGEHGAPDWLDAFERLAERFDVIAPSLPGYGETERPDWMMSVHDLAAWTTWFARDIGLTQPLNVVGLSLGGWVAAEIAAVAPQFFNKMVLVGAMGVKPREGEIFDYFVESGLTGLRRCFHDPDGSQAFNRYWGGELSLEAIDRIEQHREMTCRIAWKPYMHSLTLPHLLPAISTPTLLVWGDDDQITPRDCAEIYRGGIAGARLALVDNCGHMVEMDQPEAFARLAAEFL